MFEMILFSDTGIVFYQLLFNILVLFFNFLVMLFLFVEFFLSFENNLSLSDKFCFDITICKLFSEFVLTGFH